MILTERKKMLNANKDLAQSIIDDNIPEFIRLVSFISNHKYLDEEGLNGTVNPLIIALKFKKNVTAEHLIKCNLYVKQTGIDNILPIDAAIKTHNIPAIKLFIKAGVTIDAKLINEQKAFFSAALIGDTELVELFLKCGAAPNILEKDKISALFVAVTDDNIEMTKSLLSNGADPRPQFLNSETILHVAAKNENIELVKLILNTEVDINAQNIHGFTVLNYAVSSYNLKIAELLLEAGAAPNLKFLEKHTTLGLTVVL